MVSCAVQVEIILKDFDIYIFHRTLKQLCKRTSVLMERHGKSLQMIFKMVCDFLIHLNFMFLSSLFKGDVCESPFMFQ